MWYLRANIFIFGQSFRQNSHKGLRYHFRIYELMRRGDSAIFEPFAYNAVAFWANFYQNSPVGKEIPHFFSHFYSNDFALWVKFLPKQPQNTENLIRDVAVYQQRRFRSFWAFFMQTFSLLQWNFHQNNPKTLKIWSETLQPIRKGDSAFFKSFFLQMFSLFWAKMQGKINKKLTVAFQHISTLQASSTVQFQSWFKSFMCKILGILSEKFIKKLIITKKVANRYKYTYINKS